MQQSSRTIVVGVYGSFQVHPWLQGGHEEDAYSLFVSRSTALGWATVEGSPSESGLWAMNEASQEWSIGETNGLVARYQVGMPDEAHAYQALPVQPLLACIDDCLRRVGELELAAVQLFLPPHSAEDSSARVLGGLNWFNVLERPGRTAVTATCDAVADEDFGARAEAVLAWLRRVRSGGFSVDSVSAEDVGAVVLESPVVGELWTGGRRQRVTFRGAVPEWSLDAVAVFSSLLWEGCRRQGVQGSMLLSVARSAT